MGKEEIMSAGIDIGTTTTQLVFSRMILENTGGFGRIPQVKVVSKEIVYRSGIYFTPLSSREEIDGKKVSQIIESEYEKAGIKPEELATGAVIITGETSRKRNAKSVLHEISDIAGNFVVAAAGADLESVLAGRGSGAAELSKKTDKIVANLDIGGGTTNICVFKDGRNVDTACFDIGGRLVKLDGKRISYVAPKMKQLVRMLNLNIKEGEEADINELKKLTDVMAEVLAQSVMSEDKGKFVDLLMTNHTLSGKYMPEIISFSGGVASCFNKKNDMLEYGDVGVMLADSIKHNEEFKKTHLCDAKETMRATVIGAGNYSMNISGSTIEYTTKCFPMKNVPVVRLRLEDENDIDKLDKELHKSMALYHEEKSDDRQIAISMKGLKCPSFLQIQHIAEKIMNQYKKETAEGRPLILVMEEDIGKALGKALEHIIKGRRSIVCVDGISCDSGDFIDLGEPVSSGSVIPVVVKTLIFNG